MRRAVITIAVFAMLVASCAADSEETTETTTVAEVESDEVEVSTTEPPDTSTDQDATPIELGDPDWDELERRVLPVMGGLELGVPADHVIHHDGDMALVRSPYRNDAGRYLPTMVIAHASTLPSGEPIGGIEEFTTTALGDVGVATQSDETLELFGLTLQRWSFEMADDLPVGPHYLYSAYPLGTGGPSQWQPFPLGELFLADTESGVFALGWIGVDESGLAEAKAIFDAVAPTLSFDSDPLNTPATPVTPISAGPPLDPPPPVALPEGWEALESSSQPLDAGTYVSANVGTPLQFTIDDGWWVQPNLPSWVVITGDDSFGPGDRGLAFRTGLGAIIPVGSDYQVSGEPITFTDAQDLVANAPAGLSITESSALVGGLDAIQLDLEMTAVDSCGPGTVCEYQLGSIYPFPGPSLRIGYLLRIYYLADGLDEPLWIVAETPDARWFDRVEEVIETIEFG